MKSKFICEKCEREFESQKSCEIHEATCIGKQIVISISMSFKALLYVICVPGEKSISTKDADLIFTTNKHYASMFPIEESKSVVHIIEKVLENIYKDKLAFTNIDAYKKEPDVWNYETDKWEGNDNYEKISGYENILEALRITVEYEEVKW